MSGVESSNAPFICIQHFEKDALVVLKNGKCNLLIDAMPTIFKSPSRSGDSDDTIEFLEVDEVQLLELELEAQNTEITSLKERLSEFEKKSDVQNHHIRSQAECIDDLKEIVNRYEAYSGKPPDFVDDLGNFDENTKSIEKMEVRMLLIVICN